MSHDNCEEDRRAFFFDEFFGGVEHDQSVQSSFRALLVRVDDALQQFTLGLTPAKPFIPHLSSQKYRALPGYEIRDGSAEPQSPLQIDLPAIELDVRRIKHGQRGSSTESVLMPGQEAVPSKMKHSTAAVLAGPACLRYPGIPEDYEGDSKRRHYAWPTGELKMSMEGLVPGVFWLSEPPRSPYHILEELYVHSGRRSKYQIQLVQRTSIKEYAETEPERLCDKNSLITVRWNVLFWRVPTPGMPTPEAAVAYLCLRYFLRLPLPAPKPPKVLHPRKRAILPRSERTPRVFSS